MMVATAWTREDIDACAMTTAVDLLDTLLDACAIARPGRDAARYARDLRYLAEGAAAAADDLRQLLQPPARRAVA